MAGIQLGPGNREYDENYQRQQQLSTSQAKLNLIPDQVAEQQGLSNLQQLASLFGLSANVSPSTSLAARSGLQFGAPPQPAPFPRSGWSPASQGK